MESFSNGQGPRREWVDVVAIRELERRAGRERRAVLRWRVLRLFFGMRRRRGELIRQVPRAGSGTEISLVQIAERIERRRRLLWWSKVMVAGLGALALGVGVAIGAAAVCSRLDQPEPARLPAGVQAFANALPGAQTPNAAGLTVISSASTGPATWQVEWVTRAEGFCFATVSPHASATTACSAPGTTATGGQTVTIVGRTGSYVFGFIQGNAASYVGVSYGSNLTLTAAEPIGSGLTGYYAPLPDSWVSPEPYEVTAYDQGASIGSAIG